MPNALPIDRLRVRSLDVDRLEVTWEVNDTQEDALDYTFQIFRSESPSGPFDPVTQTFEDRYIFVDARIPAGDKYRQLWYKLVVVRKNDLSTKEYGPVSNDAEPDLVAGFIRRSEMTLLTQVIGRACWLFKARSFGTRCPSCWDPITQKRTRGACLDCYATSYLRGYLDPIEIYVQIDPSTNNQQNNPQQIAQFQATTARTSFYPNIAPNDMLVEAENKRWRILTVTASERLRATVKQELTMKQIETTDIEMKIPINLTRALKDIQPSPGRMFTNPTDLQDAIDERVPNIFANYPTYPSDAGEE